MNESPEGTPNPLNPNPVAAGATPATAGAGVTPAAAVKTASIAQARPVATPAARPAAKPVAAPTGLSMDFMQSSSAGGGATARPAPAPRTGSAMPVMGGGSAAAGSATGAGSAEDAIAAVMAESAAAANTTDDLVAKDSIVEPKDKKKGKKIALIVGIALVVVAVICGVVAAILLLGGGNDRVSAAINKWLDGQNPTNIVADGSLTINSSDPESAYASIQVDFNSKNDVLSSSNATTATVAITTVDEQEVSFDVDEVQVNGGDLFLKLSNLTSVNANETEVLEAEINGDDVIMTEECDESVDGEGCAPLVTDELNCTSDAEGDGDETNCIVAPAPVEQTNESISMLIALFGSVDNQWIRIPLGEATTEDDEMNISLGDNSACLATTAEAISQNRNSIAEFYRQHSFITSSTDNLKIAASGNDPLYRLSFDSDKLAAFDGAISSAPFADNLFSCADNSGAAGLDGIFSGTPVVYAEVNDNNDFSRINFSGTMADGFTTVTADLKFSYPNTVQVNEPAEYLDLTEILTNFLFSYYGDLTGGDVITDEGEVVEGEEVIVEDWGEEVTE